MNHISSILTPSIFYIFNLSEIRMLFIIDGISDSVWRRQWHPTSALLPGKSHGWRSLVGGSPWGRTESDTTEWLHFHFSFHALVKEMATHSSTLAWRIPGMGEPGWLPFMGLQRVGHDWSDLAAAAKKDKKMEHIKEMIESKRESPGCLTSE